MLPKGAYLSWFQTGSWQAIYTIQNFLIPFHKCIYSITIIISLNEEFRPWKIERIDRLCSSLGHFPSIYIIKKGKSLGPSTLFTRDRDSRYRRNLVVRDLQGESGGRRHEGVLGALSLNIWIDGESEIRLSYVSIPTAPKQTCVYQPPPAEDWHGWPKL